MPPARHKQNGGCWICKLRRKRCDEHLPTCGDCHNLEIECQYGLKPSWMDGGMRQRQKASSLKEEIKRNAVHKREQAQNHKITAPHVNSRPFDIISGLTIAAGSLGTQSLTPPSTEEQTSNRSTISVPTGETALIDTLPWNYQHHQRSDTLEQASANEWNFVMKYIDFVFPAIFPTYQPHIFDTGRSWLLLLLRKSKIAYHAALGLSCYFFTMALSDAEEGDEHATCKQIRWEEVERETGKCFDSLRADISALNLSQDTIPLSAMEKAGLMNSITQVIIFEISMGKSSPWNTHLPAAIKLFEEVMASPGARPVYLGEPQSKFASVLLGIGDPLWTNPWPSNHIWSPEQTGFRFCAGYLIFIDIMASTAIGETPQLSRYHRDVLAEVDDGQLAVGEAEIRLSTIVGCRNSVATSIAKVSDVISCKRTHGLDHQDVESVARSANVSDAQIKSSRNIAKSNIACAMPYPDYSKDLDPTALDKGNAPPIPCIVELVWGLAAEIYRLTALRGWNLNDPGIQSNVACILGLLKSIPQERMRTLSWPIFVAGCLAREHQEASFTAIFSTLSRVHAVGSLSDVRKITEKVWRNRVTLDGRGHDLASGIQTLGPPVLII